MSHFWSAVVALALALPAPAVAQDQLDTLRIDSLMAIAADRIQTTALAAAKEDAEAVIEANHDLFGYGGVFVDILSELTDVDCHLARSWVGNTAQRIFIVTERLTLAWDRSSDGEMDRWPQGPELILDDLESLQERWAEIKDENREYCREVRGSAGSPILNPPPTPGPSPTAVPMVFSGRVRSTCFLARW